VFLGQQLEMIHQPVEPLSFGLEELLRRWRQRMPLIESHVQLRTGADSLYHSDILQASHSELNGPKVLPRPARKLANRH
jgi:hypothetical protein